MLKAQVAASAFGTSGQLNAEIALDIENRRPTPETLALMLARELVRNCLC